MPDPRVIFKILAENKQAKQVLAETASTFDRLGAGVGKLALPAAAVLGGIAAGAFKAADAASDVEQAYGALESVFKGSAGTAKGFADDAATAVGLASSDYANLAAILGAQLKGMGTAADELAPKTDALINLGADLSATFGGETSDAVSALSALLRGERDPIERYGVSIKEADVKAQKAAMGLSGLTGEADKQATATATLALLTKQTADAQGAFARESDTAAHAQQVANAEFKNAEAALGQVLLPIVVAAADAFASLAKWVGQNKETVQALVVVVGAIAAAILAVNAAMTAWRAITTIATAAQWLLNIALSANPIGIVVLAIAALVAGIILLWQNSETFRTIVTGAFDAFMGIVKTAGEVVGRVFATIAQVIGGVVDFIVSAFGPLFGVLTAPFRLFLGLAIKVVRFVLTNVVPPIIDSFRAGFDTIAGVINAVVGVIRPIFDTVVGIVKTAIATITNVWKAVTTALTKPIKDAVRIITDAIGGIVDAIKNALGFINSLFDKINSAVDAIADLPFGKAAPAAPAGGVAVPGLRAARASGGGGGGSAGPITVNVYTTGDSMQAEQAVLKALRRQTRLNGGVVPAFGWSGTGLGSRSGPRLGVGPSPQPRG